VAVAVANAALPDSATGRAWASVLLLVIPWLGLGGWPLLASRRRGRGPRLDFGLRLSGHDAALAVALGLTGLIAALLVALLVTLVRGVAMTSAVGDLALGTTSASRAALVTLAVLAVVGAPVVEELAFRGLLYGTLERAGVGAVGCVGWTSFAFALFHLEPARLPVLVVLGLVLGLVRWRTGSTAAAMVAHATINLPGAVSLLLL